MKQKEPKLGRLLSARERNKRLLAAREKRIQTVRQKLTKFEW